MARSKDTVMEETIIKVGATCLLNATNRHFLVRILEVTDEAIRATFPVKDYLVSGMVIDLEFHREDGYFQCYTQVVKAPTDKGEGVLLDRPGESRWNAHRDSNRVETDLTVHVRDVAHPRCYDAHLVNISAGGALICTRAPLAIPAQVEMALSLPGEPQHTVIGRVVHMSCDEAETRCFGIRFVDLAENAYDSILRFVTGVLVNQGHDA